MYVENSSEELVYTPQQRYRRCFQSGLSVPSSLQGLVAKFEKLSQRRQSREFLTVYNGYKILGVHIQPCLMSGIVRSAVLLVPHISQLLTQFQGAANAL